MHSILSISPAESKRMDTSSSLGYPSNAEIGYFISKFPYPYSKKIAFILTTDVNNTSKIQRLNANHHNVACLLLYYRNQTIKKAIVVLKRKNTVPIKL
jgi:hypothetical protein